MANSIPILLQKVSQNFARESQKEATAGGPETFTVPEPLWNYFLKWRRKQWSSWGNEFRNVTCVVKISSCRRENIYWRDTIFVCYMVSSTMLNSPCWPCLSCNLSGFKNQTEMPSWHKSPSVLAEPGLRPVQLLFLDSSGFFWSPKPTGAERQCLWPDAFPGRYLIQGKLKHPASSYSTV